MQRSYYSTNGEEFSYAAMYQVFRVKIVSKTQRLEPGNKRMTGYAQVVYCDPETGDLLENDDGSHKLGEVRARDIATRWDEYWDDHEHREVEREREQAERERIQRERRAKYEEEERIRREERIKAEEERLRILEEKRQKEAAKQEAIKKFLSMIGVPEDGYSITADYVYINRGKLEEVICTTTEY